MQTVFNYYFWQEPAVTVLPVPLFSAGTQKAGIDCFQLCQQSPFVAGIPLMAQDHAPAFALTGKYKQPKEKAG